MVLLQRACFTCIRYYSISRCFLNRRMLINKHLRQCYTGADLKTAGRYSSSDSSKNGVDNNIETSNLAEELAGKLDTNNVHKILVKFFQRPELQSIILERGIEDVVFANTKVSFIDMCINTKLLSAELHIKLFDVTNGYGHILDLLPFFMEHLYSLHPHMRYRDELSKIGNLTEPVQWYPQARNFKRKIIFHGGPTNSGKTYSALKSFYKSKTGVYCAPLKLLATEIYQQSNDKGVACDLITGEEKKTVLPGLNANHISCTIEMLSTEVEYDVAVIDEIQMLKDPYRGFAWTRAFLGVVAKEVHLCGEQSALDYIRTVANLMNETLEVHEYKRLTELHIEEKPMESLMNVKKGDCIVCFSKKDIFKVSAHLEKQGIQCAVIYGNLPPGTKVAQTKMFNDPENNCSVLVATDAVGLGMNLNIRRIIFQSLTKYEEVMGGKKKTLISSSLALQIAGRAGRYRSEFPAGYVTTFHASDLKILKQLLAAGPAPVSQAGLQPSAEQIEMFSYYLPKMTLSQLIDVFTSLSNIDNSLFFLCDLKHIKRLAENIQHLPLPLKTMYTLCNAPVNTNSSLVMTLFIKLVKKFSADEIITLNYLQKQLVRPIRKPDSVDDLVFLEDVFDCLDLYLWLGYRYPTYFTDSSTAKDLQLEVDILILDGIVSLMGKSRRKMGKVSGADSGKLSNSKIEARLLRKGILSPSLLAQLKSEWSREQTLNNKNKELNEE